MKSYLFLFEDMVNKECLKGFIGKIDAELFKRVCFEILSKEKEKSVKQEL